MAAAHRPELPKAIPDEIKQIVGSWQASWRRRASRSNAPQNAHLSLGGDNRLLIVVDDGVNYDNLSREENRKHVEDMISNFAQKEVSVEIRRLDPGGHFEENYPDLEKAINMDIEIEDE